MLNPQQLSPMPELPELLTCADGSIVKTADDWIRRRAEILALYRHYVYGDMPDARNERLTWRLASPDDGVPGVMLHIAVTVAERAAQFAVHIALPDGDAPEDGFPCFIEYVWRMPDSEGRRHWRLGDNRRCAVSRNYAAIAYDPTQAAADNASFTGAFYTLYPYGPDADDQRGALLAWAWGVSRIIDALEQGAASALHLNAACCLVAGVSRYGKSAAVAGAYDERIRVTIPCCSGAGGTALFRTSNEGKTYDLSSLGGPSAWTNDSANEPLSNLQNGLGYWFCGRFAQIPDALSIPVDQHMLCALAAGVNRHFINVTGMTSEGWNNTEGQALAWAASLPVWKLLGIQAHSRMIVHLNGHALLPTDLRMILDHCDVHIFGKNADSVETDLRRMQANLFIEHNRSVLHPWFAPHLP